MPCPLFLPTRSLGEMNPGPTPLGDLFAGLCQADPAFDIPTETLCRCCNFGYAKDRCTLAQQSAADSTCFLLSRIGEDTVTVKWAIERDHHPFDVGEFEVARESQRPKNPIETQAQAYASVYWRRLS